MNETRGNRLHIGIYGRRNVGKSSILNAILGQDFSIISDTPGTTTDVNQKAMELLPFGPVLLMDTAGYDDTGELGFKRIESTQKTLQRADVAFLVIDEKGMTPLDVEFQKELKKRNIPTLVVFNKKDLCTQNGFGVSAKEDRDIVGKIKEELLKLLPNDFIKTNDLLEGLVSPSDVILLVTPIDKEAPKGRLILPQVQTIRSLLDNNCITVVVTENKLQEALLALKGPPKLIITDSQAFKQVEEILPSNIPLTSFSILFAKLKGDIKSFIQGACALDTLKNGDKILVCESCTHHAIEDDIGKVKIPNLIKKYTQKEVSFEHYSGYDFPNDIEKYALIVHCGACMTNRKEVLSRILKAQGKRVPITNYGITIAKCLGILERATEIV